MTGAEEEKVVSPVEQTEEAPAGDVPAPVEGDAPAEEEKKPEGLNAELITAAVENMMNSTFSLFVELPNNKKFEIVICQGKLPFLNLPLLFLFNSHLSHTPHFSFFQVTLLLNFVFT